MEWTMGNGGGLGRRVVGWKGGKRLSSLRGTATLTEAGVKPALLQGFPSLGEAQDVAHALASKTPRRCQKIGAAPGSSENVEHVFRALVNGGDLNGGERLSL